MNSITPITFDVNVSPSYWIIIHSLKIHEAIYVMQYINGEW